MEKIRIIAEIGENHLGDIEIAKRLVKSASLAGADFVKFQSYSFEDLAENTEVGIIKSIKKTQISEDDHFVLIKECRKEHIEFLSTPVNVYWANFLKDIGCNRVKIASLSLTNHDLLSYVGKNFDEVFLSTGMGSIDEIHEALKILNNKNTTIFHCVSNYPVEDIDAQLKSILFLKEKLPYPIGYSDHTIGVEACLAAAALGAEVIEKHFTENKNYEGTDHILSADYDDLVNIINQSKKINSMLGKKDKLLNQSELENKITMRNLFVERK